MKCHKCGFELLSTAKFCGGCGVSQQTSAPPPLTPSTSYTQTQIVGSEANQSKGNSTSFVKPSFFSAAAASALDAAKKINAEAKRISEERHIKEKIEDAAVLVKAAQIIASNKVIAEAKRLGEEHHIKERLVGAAGAANAAAAKVSNQLGEAFQKIKGPKN
jgi:ribonuclease HIII